MKKTSTGYEQDITGVFARLEQGEGQFLHQFINDLETEHAKCLDKGMRYIRIKSHKGAFGTVVKLVGRK